jgi:hypothetical protein
MSPAEFPDTLALARDELLLDALSLRREPQGDGAEEEIGRLLAAFAAEIDEGIDEVIAAGMSADVLDGAARGADETAELDSNVVRLPVSRRGLVRGLAAGLVVAGVVSVSGVAAAVTGDPFAPYERVIAAVSGQAPHATVAQLNRSLTGVRAAIARGDLGSARSSLDEMNGQLDGLSGHDRRVMEKRIAALEASIDAATGTAKGKDGSPGAGTAQPSTKATHDAGGPSGRPTREPSPTPTKEPKAKPQPTDQPGAGGGPTAQPTPTSTATSENSQGDNGPQRTAQQGGSGSNDRAKHN